MGKEFSFFAYLVECYAQAKGVTPAEALRQWDEHDVTDFVYDMYELYHIESIDNAFADIDSLLATGKPAW